MPQESQLAHRVIRNTNIPYQTNVSPSQTEPYFASGSTDLLTSINGYAERRPGFSDGVESSPTTFNNLQRLFVWDRTDGTFYVMACDINASGFAQVFQMLAGSSNFGSIFTDTSAVPFDFVVSNNTLYFSNGFSAKKWDPVNGVSNWGIVPGSALSSANAYCGTGADNGGGAPWTNPTNIQGAPDAAVATDTVTAFANGNAQTNQLSGTNYGGALATAGATIVGVQVNLTASQSTSLFISFPRVFFNVYLQYRGATIGVFKSQVFSTSLSTLSLGGSTDTWSASLTPTIVNDSSFGIIIQGVINNLFHNSSVGCTFSVDAAQIVVFQAGPPTVSVSGAAGSMTATAGYQYVFCYGNSRTGHIGSPSPPSASTGVFTNKASVTVNVTASTDPQVNQIRVFRTTDGGGGTYFELPTSPFANTTTGITDNSADTLLQITSIAPTATFNDPPTPIRGLVYFSGRIWGFTGTKVWFTGLEEINQGVPEESMPSGIGGNFWAFDQPVQALAVAGSGSAQALGVLCGGRLYVITGNTLDTFRRFLVSNRRGCRSVTAIASLGGMVAWLDSSNQIWATDGNSLNELSGDIRPDLIGLNPTNCSMTFHVGGRFHWLVFSTGAKIFVYDLDLNQWMPPWSFAAQYVYSGEVSPGNYVLMAATATKALQQNNSKFNDNGATYQPIVKTGLMALVPDYGRRFSYMAMGIYDEPTRTGVPFTWQVTNNNQSFADIQFLVDDDPKLGTYASVSTIAGTTTPVDTAVAYNRVNGTNMTQKVWQVTQPSGRWISLLIKLANADQVDQIYEIIVAYKPLGGR
ncbi:MAG TPA: hypothetical protein VF748_16080 [Candidatus Acidoferrum sp.]